MGLELLRQIHYFVSERWSAYHRFWTNGVFGGFDRAMKRRFSDWTRFRLARVLKWIAFIVLFAVVAGQILETRRCWRCSRRPRCCGRPCR